MPLAACRNWEARGYSKAFQKERVMFPMRTFPCNIVYVTDPRAVVVAVMHGHQHPLYWLDRLDDAMDQTATYSGVQMSASPAGMTAALHPRSKVMVS